MCCVLYDQYKRKNNKKNKLKVSENKLQKQQQIKTLEHYPILNNNNNNIINGNQNEYDDEHYSVHYQYSCCNTYLHIRIYS